LQNPKTDQNKYKFDIDLIDVKFDSNLTRESECPLVTSLMRELQSKFDLVREPAMTAESSPAFYW
jgi:hypothetical protein